MILFTRASADTETAHDDTVVVQRNTAAKGDDLIQCLQTVEGSAGLAESRKLHSGHLNGYSGVSLFDRHLVAD